MSINRARKRDRSFRRKQSKTWCRVYVIRAHKDGPVRYVGQTRQSVEMRLWWHFKEIRRCHERGQKLNDFKLWLEGLTEPPFIEAIDEDGVIDISEAVWIDRLRRQGESLFNKASVIPDKPKLPVKPLPVPAIPLDERWKSLFYHRRRTA